MNRSVRFGFGGAAVLVAYRGDQVSFNTTVDVWMAPLMFYIQI
jgi:hypothetical protein